MSFPEITGTTGLMTIPTRHGPVTATAYYPDASVTRPGVYVNLHGGGFVIGQREQDDPWCRFLAASAGVMVINPDYALAPQHRFPVAAEQVYDLVQWASAPNHPWNGDRICVGGLSAGGSIAATVARMSLEDGGAPIALQILHCPALDMMTSPRHKRTPLGRAAVLKPWLCEVFNAAYAPSSRHRQHRFVSPAWGHNDRTIDGIAPALVVTAELDRLRDEGERYAAALEAAGSLVGYHVVPGKDHAYNLVDVEPDTTRTTYALMAEHVRAAVKQG